MRNETTSDATWMTIGEIAATYRVSKSTATRELDRAGMPYIRFGEGLNGTRRYRRQDINKHYMHLWLRSLPVRRHGEEGQADRHPSIPSDSSATSDSSESADPSRKRHSSEA